MNLARLSTVIGSLRMLRRRAVAVQQPGLNVWTDRGESAAVAARDQVRDLAHKDEVLDLEAEKEIAEGLDGLKDGRVDTVDLEHFRRAARLAHRSAESARNLGDIAQ